MHCSKYVSALVLASAGIFATNAHAASLMAGDRLTIDTAIAAGGWISSGSFFVVDFNGDGHVSAGEQFALSQGTLGIEIGHSNTAAGEITAPWMFFGYTGYDWTSTAITGGTAGIDMSGWTVNWNGYDNPLGAGAWQVLSAPVAMPTSGYADGTGIFGWSGLRGDRYTLDYTATVQSGPFQGIPWAIHLEGVVLAVPEVSNLAMMLAGLGMLGIATRKRRSGARDWRPGDESNVRPTP